MGAASGSGALHGLSPPKSGSNKGSADKESAFTGTISALISGNTAHGAQASADQMYDSMKPVSKKSFEEDLQVGSSGNQLHLGIKKVGSSDTSQKE
jgi:hypothetical protein